jgi:hypothetical protein
MCRVYLWGIRRIWWRGRVRVFPLRNASLFAMGALVIEVRCGGREGDGKVRCGGRGERKKDEEGRVYARDAV